MPVIRIETLIRAPMERCFDLARDIDFHVRSAVGTDEEAVAGVMSGLIGLGEEVTWLATHLGMRQRLTTRITVFDRPVHFRDSQVRGAFRRFDHDHFFEAAEAGSTLMRGEFDYESPCGWLCRLADWLFLEAYMRSFLLKRNEMIRAEAEFPYRAAATGLFLGGA